MNNFMRDQLCLFLFIRYFLFSSLKQEPEISTDPMANVVLGLTFYELWYSTLPKEMQWRDSDPIYSPRHSDVVGTNFSNSIRNFEGYNANDTHRADIPSGCDSDTSVMNDKQIAMDADIDQHREVPMDVDASLQTEDPMQSFQPQHFAMNSDENTGNESSLSKRGNHMHYASNFSALREFSFPHISFLCLF